MASSYRSRQRGRIEVALHGLVAHAPAPLVEIDVPVDARRRRCPTWPSASKFARTHAEKNRRHA